jgi:hypothetical protein
MRASLSTWLLGLLILHSLTLLPRTQAASIKELMSVPRDFETCDSKNSYFEPKLQNELLRIFPTQLPITNPVDHCYVEPSAEVKLAILMDEEQKKLKEQNEQQCILRVMNLWPKNSPTPQNLSFQELKKRGLDDGRFVVCDPDNKTSHYSYDRPCLSKNLAEVTRYHFKNAATCVGIDPSEIFPLIAHESRFLLNIRSPTYTAGVGQVQQSTAQKMNLPDSRSDDDLNEMEQAIVNLNDKPECSEYKELLAKKIIATKTNQSANRCALTQPPEAPAFSFLVGMKYYKMVLEQNANSMLALFNQRRVQLGASPLSSDLSQKLLIDLKRWSYNGGEAGVIACLKGFTRTNRTIIQSNDFELIRQTLQSYFASNYPTDTSQSAPQKISRRKEVSNYAIHIANESQTYQDTFGGQPCFSK